jgi:hypothetical protein
MSAADPGAVWQLLQEALHAHAAQLRRDAAKRNNGGAGLAGYRAQLRAEARLALDVEGIVNGIDPAVLTQLLIISQTRPGGYPGGPELWAVGDNADAQRRALLWARAGHPYHRFFGGEHEQMCRVCTGPAGAIQHQPFADPAEYQDGQAGRRIVLQEMDKSRLAMLAHRKLGKLSLGAYREWLKEDLVDAVLKAEYPGTGES